MVHQALLDLTDRISEKEQEILIIGVLRKSLSLSKVQYFPIAKPKSGTVGAPSSKPVFDSWGNLGQRDKKRKRRNDNGIGSQEPVPAAMVALNNVIAKNCNVEWLAKGLSLGTLKTMICKTMLLTDFTVPSLAEEAYVNETYRWVKDNYNRTKTLHHLMLMVGIVVASMLLPKLFMPTEMKSKFVDAKMEEKVWKVFGDMKWKTKGKKGMSDKQIFVGMFTTLIIMIYEKESPLRRHMDGSQRRGLGNIWTAKHSEYDFGYFWTR